MTMSNCIDHGKIGDKDGYTTVRYNGEVHRAHRVVYCQHNNVTIESIKSLVVRHSCDNTRCINPEHLLLGTHQDNMDDKMERGRWHGGAPSGEKNGRAKLTEEQVLWARSVYIPRHKEFGAKALSKKLNVSKSTMSAAIIGKYW